MKQGKMVPSKPLVELIKDKIVKVGNKVTYILDGNLLFYHRISKKQWKSLSLEVSHERWCKCCLFTLFWMLWRWNEKKIAWKSKDQWKSWWQPWNHLEKNSDIQWLNKENAWTIQKRRWSLNYCECCSNNLKRFQISRCRFKKS